MVRSSHPRRRVDTAEVRLGGATYRYLAFEGMDADLPTVLSPAERVIAALVCEGCSNAEIAAARGTSVHTVGNQLSILFKKLGVSSRLALIEHLTQRSSARATERTHERMRGNRP